MLDGRAEKLCGVAAPTGPNHPWDTRQPSNVNDSDLHPDKKDPPADHAGATEMIFCSIRYEIRSVMQQAETGPKLSIGERDNLIGQLETRLQNKYLRYCDASIPTHFLAVNLARLAVLGIKLAVHHPRQYADSGATLPQEENDMLFSTCLKLMECHNSILRKKTLQKYLWHIGTVYPLEAMIFVLRALAYGKVSEAANHELVERTWQEIGRAYDFQPKLLNNPESALCLALNKLAIKAWKKTKGGVQDNSGLAQLAIPHFLATMRSQNKQSPLVAAKQPQNEPVASEAQFLITPDSAGQWHDIGDGLDQDLSLDWLLAEDNSPAWDWEYWQSLLDDQQL